MSDVIIRIENEMSLFDLHFSQAPIVIGGMAMEYYDIRKAGSDIDLIICDSDYQNLAHKYPDKKKDIWGDLGVVLEPFEIWRSIMLFDYDFFKQGAVTHNQLLIISLDKLLFTRVCTMGIGNEKTKSKYEIDLKLIEKYYFERFRNQDFVTDTVEHHPLDGRNKLP